VRELVAAADVRGPVLPAETVARLDAIADTAEARRAETRQAEARQAEGDGV
jgi:hypothetical protein